MPLKNNSSEIQMIVLCLFVAAATLFSLNSHAARKEPAAALQPKWYIIQEGDTLGSIAQAHGIRIETLINENQITNPDRIFFGMKIQIPIRDNPQSTIVETATENPSATRPTSSETRKATRTGVTITVPPGISLGRIARAYGVSVRAIMSANRSLSNPDRLRAGQKIRIPGATTEVELLPPPPCFSDPVAFYRVRTDETKHISLTYCNGRVNPDGLTALSELSAPPGLEEIPFPLHANLAILLQKVTGQYPGKRIEIYSGQRLAPRSSKPDNESYHYSGRAIDFRVQGVTNRTLASYLRRMDNVGVGYYPNSHFVHMDTRDRSAFWVDHSRPGEQAIYGSINMNKKDIESIRKNRIARNTSVVDPSTSAESVSAPLAIQEATDSETAEPAATADIRKLIDTVMSSITDSSVSQPLDSSEEASSTGHQS